jgi:hypothetical protein
VLLIFSTSKDLLNGAIQSFLYWNYELQIFSLMGLELSMILIYLYFEIKHQSLKQASFWSCFILKGSCFVVIDLLLIIDYRLRQPNPDDDL